MSLMISCPRGSGTWWGLSSSASVFGVLPPHMSVLPPHTGVSPVIQVCPLLIQVCPLLRQVCPVLILVSPLLIHVCPSSYRCVPFSAAVFPLPAQVALILLSTSGSVQVASDSEPHLALRVLRCQGSTARCNVRG